MECPSAVGAFFFLGYHKSTSIYEHLVQGNPEEWLLDSGTVASSFSVQQKGKLKSFLLEDDLVSLSNTFNLEKGLSPFQNSGVCFDNAIYTLSTLPDYHGTRVALSDVLEKQAPSPEFYIPEEDIPKWEYLKGAKKEIRKTKEGFAYHYSEGSMIFPDALNQPSRTIITGEGGKSPSRFKHVVQTSSGLRRLTPIELERLNLFPDNHTQLDGISNAKRAFFMGNALVVGVVEQMGNALFQKINTLEKQFQN